MSTGEPHEHHRIPPLDRFLSAGGEFQGPPCPVETARRLGLTDEQILGWLVRHAGFDITAARSAGYSDDEIIRYLADERRARSVDGEVAQNAPAVAPEPISPAQTETRAMTGNIPDKGSMPSPTPLEALALGWSIIPVGPDKKPLVAWKRYQTQRPTKEQIIAWEKKNPAGWAIVTGALSNRVTLDGDGEAGRRTLEALGVPAPHRRSPRGGYHVDCVWPGWPVPTLNCKSDHGLMKRCPGLDIRGNGGYVVYRGTTPEGKYEWIGGSVEPYNLPAEVWEKIFPAPVEDAPPPAINAGKKAADPKNKAKGEAKRVDSERLIRKALGMVAAGSGRNDAGAWLAAQLRDNGYTQAETLAMNYVERCPATSAHGVSEPYTVAEWSATVHSIYSRLPREPWADKKHYELSGTYVTSAVVAAAEYSVPAPSTTPDLLAFMQNDVGNGERLLALHRHDLRYCHAFKKWLVWDGRRWMIDLADRAENMAKGTILEYLRQAVETRDEINQKFARASLDVKRIRDMLMIVHYEFHIAPEELDRNPWLLNFQNCTVDLRSSDLYPQRREDFITKLIHHNYHPDAERLQWLQFLERIMGGGLVADQAAQTRAWEFINYLQRALGYSLTGVTSEKAVFMPFGKGDNGKSTMLTVFRNLVEEYATLLQIDTLMVRQESNNSQADLADLYGARFAQTSEAEEGQRLSQSKLKRITQGMGRIKAIRKYENPFEFGETHKLWIDTNHKPIIREADDVATFSRLHLIPFTVQIPESEIDKEMPDKLLHEAEGILAWAVEGARLWYENGLQKPKEVDQAREAYRDEMDQIGRFISECCMLASPVSVTGALLYAQYKYWCNNSGEHPVSATKFGLRLKDRFKSSHTDKGIRYEGIGLIDLLDTTRAFNS